MHPPNSESTNQFSIRNKHYKDLIQQIIQKNPTNRDAKTENLRDVPRLQLIKMNIT